MNITGPRVARLQAEILKWGENARRDLPWRRTRDPWAILVSEVMLAQTQVVRVVSKWQVFMARWPTPSACAAAPVGDVIALWSGLGYNRRAVHLHRAAAEIVARHGGVIPADLAGLRALPGVGAYTARAVLAFAFDQPVGVVETNSARVLARAMAGRPLTASAGQVLADRVVPARQAWAWNQAMLDLGATVCTARRPRCCSCPLGPGAARPGPCAWARAGSRDPDPAAGSAGTSRAQSAFAGSDRQGRGRLLARLTDPSGPGEVPAGGIAAAAGWPDQPARADVAAQSLIDDGLAVAGPNGSLRLP